MILQRTKTHIIRLHKSTWKITKSMKIKPILKLFCYILGIYYLALKCVFPNKYRKGTQCFLYVLMCIKEHVLGHTLFIVRKVKFSYYKIFINICWLSNRVLLDFRIILCVKREWTAESKCKSMYVSKFEFIQFAICFIIGK